MSSRARLVASGSSTCGARDTSAMRSSVAIVGLVSTAATPGSASRSRTASIRLPHSSTWPSAWASSKTALAYLLAAAVATGNLRDRTIDQLAVLGVVQGLADDLLGRGHDKLGDFAAHRLDGPLPLGFDLLAGGFDGAL